jgi:hypothetical protein
MPSSVHDLTIPWRRRRPKVHVVFKSSPSPLQPKYRILETWPHSPPTTFDAGLARTSRPAPLAARTGPRVMGSIRSGTWSSSRLRSSAPHRVAGLARDIGHPRQLPDGLGTRSGVQMSRLPAYSNAGSMHPRPAGRLGWLPTQSVVARTAQGSSPASSTIAMSRRCARTWLPSCTWPVALPAFSG